MILDITKRLDEIYEAIEHKDLHIQDHFYTPGACLVPPEKPINCLGNYNKL